MDVQRVIVDVDVGMDDFLALLMLFRAEALGLLIIQAITCSLGNAPVKDTCTNLVRLLELTHKTHIPVYEGALDQLIPPSEPIKVWYGQDGMGDLNYTDHPNLDIIRKEPSSWALNHFAETYPNQITLISLCSLTNTALALKTYAGFGQKLKDIWIMGGNSREAELAEFNFLIDPEAAHIVVEGFGGKIHLLPWETCNDIQNITYNWRYTNIPDNSPALVLLNKADKSIYDKADNTPWVACDPMLVYTFLDPQNNIKLAENRSGTVPLDGSNRGILQYNSTETPNMVVIEQFDIEGYKEQLIQVATKKCKN